MSPNLVSVKIENLIDFPDDISVYMMKVTIDAPLQIICSDPSSAFQFVFQNHDLIQAAGGVVRFDNKILMIYRNGLWDIPKGKVEAGEDIKTGAIREVEEECGIIGPSIESDLCETYHTYLYKGHKTLKKTTWFVMSYFGEEKLVPQIDEGITAVKWFSLKDFLATRGKTYGSINEVIDQYQSSFLDK